MNEITHKQPAEVSCLDCRTLSNRGALDLMRGEARRHLSTHPQHRPVIERTTVTILTNARLTVAKEVVAEVERERADLK